MSQTHATRKSRGEVKSHASRRVDAHRRDGRVHRVRLMQTAQRRRRCHTVSESRNESRHESRRRRPRSSPTHEKGNEEGRCRRHHCRQSARHADHEVGHRCHYHRYRRQKDPVEAVEMNHS